MPYRALHSDEEGQALVSPAFPDLMAQGADARPVSGSAAQARVDAATGFLAQNTSEEVGALRQRGGGEVDVRPQPSNPMCGSPPNKPCPGHPSLVTHAVPETSDQAPGDHMPEQRDPAGHSVAHQNSEGSNKDCTTQHCGEEACTHACTSTEHDATEAGEEAGDFEAGADSDEPDQWMPGQVWDVFVGGGEVQDQMEEAHGMGLQLVVILWHATWAHVADDVLRAVQTLAARHQHVMFLCLDVEASGDNRKFAFEKIMKAASSQRRDAKPVLKSGGKWPAITLHTPPILQPNRSFEGADACRHLQMHLVEAAASFLPHTAPDDGSQLEDASPEGTPADESGDGEPDGEQEPPRAASGHVVSNDQHHSHCNDAEHSGVRQCSEWKKGALDMRDCYKTASGSDSAVITLITDSDSCSVPCTELQRAWNGATQQHSDVVFATMDVAVSKSNRALAAKLASPLQYPAILLKRSKTVETTCRTQPGSKPVDGAKPQDASEKQASSGQTTASKQAQAAPAAPTVQLLQGVGVAMLEKVIRETSCCGAANTRAKPPGGASSRAGARTAAKQGSVEDMETAKSGKGSIYDPPKGAAKRPGTCRTFRKKGGAVSAIYWPRMPCLRCGCPWWLGEDWDAVCVRCNWSCEFEGYDNDSNPVQKGGWRERFNKFTALLKQGQTSAWPPVR